MTEHYYVIQVSAGSESLTEEYIEKIVSREAYSDLFHPMRLVRKKFGNEWKDVHQKLLPGYVFVRTSSPDRLFAELKKVPKMTKMLGEGDEFFVPLNDDEEEWLAWLLGKCSESETNPYIAYEVGISYAELDENDRIKVISGPLVGL
jgi:transcriptional antiterminator NusG